MTHHDDDTIAAIATPIGVGGISVLRVSGVDALAIADKCFRGKTQLSLTTSHTAHFGEFVDAGGAHLDQVVATVFRSPNSYTSDDTVEISCHGGMFVTKKVLEALLNSGARMAEPGEFTKRAFLNGKIDLAQAEAVGDLINSGSEAAHRTSVSQLEGRLSARIREIRKELLDSMGLLELELDFSEEGLEFIDKSNIINKLDGLAKYIVNLLDSYSLGKVYREGVKVVIAGKPNVGKSSLLNALLDHDRAIVTPVPGTTRDVIEENIVLEGILFRLVDTAGIRQSSDHVEGLGIQRSAAELSEAGIVLFVIDLSTGFTKEDKDVLAQIDGLNRDVRSVILVENKIDIGTNLDCPPDRFSKEQTVCISAKNLTGLEILRKRLVLEAASRATPSEGSVLITNARHKNALELTLGSLSSAKKSTASGLGNDLIAIDLRDAINHLGEIVGEVTSEDVLNNIFGSFCVGK